MTLPIKVKNLQSGQVLELEVQSGDIVETLQARITEEIGVPPDAQKLVYRGKAMVVGKRLEEYNLPKGGVIHLVMKLKASVNISIRIMTGKVLPFDLNPALRVRDVISMVQEILAHELADKPRCLNFQGRRLDPESSMTEHGIPDRAVLYLILVPQYYQSPAAPAATEEGDRLRAYGDLGTLYARCGGIFGVAAFVDRCMDGWMADAVLNANRAVATWHEQAQRCGFKFLVTQLMGYLTGGPQAYTGKDMAASHKHLNINGEQWTSFMAVMGRICAEFRLPEQDVDDLTAVIASMMSDCIVPEGEVAPPKPRDPPIRGNTLYARMGGVYPIALFADRVVDALLADSTVKIPLDGQKRSAVTLKYFLIELICHASGGPEVMTAASLPETRLLASSKEFFQLMRCAEAASDHLPVARHRTELMRCVFEQRALILDPARIDRSDPQGLERKVNQISASTGVPIVYVVGGGAVFLAGRDRHFGDANPRQQEQCWAELGKLGFRRQRVLEVKSAEAAAAGATVDAAALQARVAGEGAYIAAQLRVRGDSRTLYGRGGGIFGLAALADRLMDVWMADGVLNANAMVARWHNSGQKEGFKFLVTQVMGYLTGGPQKYTGQPMDVAHKHLNINQAQWSKFIADANEVFGEFNLDDATQADLRGILESLRGQCVVAPGERVPEDPGLCRKPPSGRSLYAQAGGVYPLARFVNDLIDAAFDESLRIVRNATRTPAGLKYLSTELVCNAAGGPEIVTSKDFDEAKLGILPSDWGRFLELAQAVSTAIWGEGVVQASVVAMLEEQRNEFCVGAGHAAETAACAARQRVRNAGYSAVEVTGALLQANGDADQAIELLGSGWKPEMRAPSSGVGRCPFLSGAASGGFSGGCPFLASSGAAASPSVAQEAPMAQTAQSVADRTEPQKPWMAGRVLGNPLQQRLDDLLVEPPELCCPVTLSLFETPVIASDGCAYEREAIARLIAAGRASPMTQEALEKFVGYSPALERNVESFRAERGAQLLEIAGEAQRCQTQEETTLAQTALNRAKLYISSLPAEKRLDTAGRYLELCAALQRPLPTDLLLQVAPLTKVPIILRKADGTDKVVQLDVQPRTTLQELLQFAAISEPFSVNFMGRRLDLSEKLGDCRIEGGSVLTLVRIPEPPVNSPAPRAEKPPRVSKELDREELSVYLAADRDRIYGAAGTLYARCGGIWGVSAFVDRCMDSWMADPTLNANKAVTTWHEKAQRCGFKFLVTQLMGKLMGGPQNYTGRDMASSHKHLNIDVEQWSSFMDVLFDVCKEFCLPNEDAADLTSIILSMMDDCVVTDGEVVPRNPGHQPPAGTSLYARLGGVYPIALFADRLVDALLADSRVSIPLDGTKRAEVSLKYLFTELVCHIAGGPETMTSMQNPETFLQLSSKEMFFLLGTSSVAADHVADARAINDLRLALYENQHLMLDPRRATPWDQKMPFQCPDRSVKTFRDMQRALDRGAESIGNIRFMYCPGGLAHVDYGMTREQQQRRTELVNRLGFKTAAMPNVKSADAAAAGSGSRGM